MEKKVALIGKGMIGISLAVLFTGNGIPTVVLAKNSEVGLEKYRTYYQDLVSQGLVTPAQAAACEKRLSFTENYADLSDINVVIECVTEKLEVKYEVYQQIEAHCPHLKAIDSTTSAISDVYKRQSGNLRYAALADLGMADYSLTAVGIFPADNQTVPAAAFLYHRELLSCLEEDSDASRCCRYRFSSSPKFLI